MINTKTPVDTSVKVNEHIVQIMGGRKNLIHIDQPLRMGEDFDLKVSGSVSEIHDIDNGDGSVDRIYKVKGIYCEEL